MNAYRFVTKEDAKTPVRAMQLPSSNTNLQFIYLSKIGPNGVANAWQQVNKGATISVSFRVTDSSNLCKYEVTYTWIFANR